MSFANLKKSEKKSFAQLKEHIEKENKKFDKSSTQDEENTEFWKLTVDKSTGAGQAVIRFLPNRDLESYPYVKKFVYNFNNPATRRFYNENSPTTIGLPCPVYEYNGEIYKSGKSDSEKKALLKRRTTKYIANILVISDPKNPDTEGKVFKFEFGPAIWKKIEAAIKPVFEDEDPLNPFSLFDGANFKLRAVNGTNNMRSYDKSEFDKPSALLDGDEDALNSLCDALYDLEQEIAPDKFKSYEELQKQFDWAMSNEKTAKPSYKAPEPKDEPQVVRESQKKETVIAQDDDDDLSAYADLLD